MAYPDNIFDKKTIGIPEDIILIRQQIKELRDQAEALVDRAEAIVREAEEAEAQRQANELARIIAEHKRVEAEYERAYNYLKMLERMDAFYRQLHGYQRAIDALGALHDEHDYMVLGSALHTRNGVGEAKDDGFQFKQGTTDGEGGLTIAGTFYGLEDTKWQN